MTQSNYDKKLAEAAEKAWSFPGLNPPNGAKYIGSIKGERATFNYYEDDKGNFYLDTDSGREFCKWFQEAEKRQKEKRRLARL